MTLKTRLSSYLAKAEDGNEASVSLVGAHWRVEQLGSVFPLAWDVADIPVTMNCRPIVIIHGITESMERPWRLRLILIAVAMESGETFARRSRGSSTWDFELPDWPSWHNPPSTIFVLWTAPEVGLIAEELKELAAGEPHVLQRC